MRNLYKNVRRRNRGTCTNKHRIIYLIACDVTYTRADGGNTRKTYFEKYKKNPERLRRENVFVVFRGAFRRSVHATNRKFFIL